MKLSRNLAVKIHFFLDQVLPPFIRDARFFNGLLFRLALGKNAATFLEFKERVLSMTGREIRQVYQDLHASSLRETDLTRNCIDAILKEVVGNIVLEVGAGRCYLARLLCAPHRVVTALDWVFPKEARSSSYSLIVGSLEQLPIKDNQIDTVICTHTLEHVKDFNAALTNLRRIAKKKLIIVVPQQRPYRYTLDLHLHFFPTPFSLLIAAGAEKATCREIDGDLFYVEKMDG